MWIKPKEAEAKLKLMGHNIPQSAIHRYCREDMDFELNAKNERLVDPELIIAFKKTQKRTGRPKAPRVKFNYDWDKFYKKLEKEGKLVKTWLAENDFKRARLYIVKSGDSYPTVEEESKLRKYI